MKLGEALILRADLQKRIEQLRERLQASVLVQEGEQPPEDPQALLLELDRLSAQLADLILRINRTNLSALLPDGTSVTDALAQRDVLKLRVGVLKGAVDATNHVAMRFRPTEIRRVPTIDVRALRREIDTLAQQHRTLDTTIQSTNWATDLLA